MDLHIERLTSRDIPDNLALANAVGWKDVESDWRVLHDAAIVLGIHVQGLLIAQSALGAYGTAGTATLQGSHSLVGPVIASTEDDARALAASIFRSAPGPARIDVPEEQRGFREWLRNLGFHEQSVRVEMAINAERLPWQVPQRFALAAQAWG